jgi:tRNA threonylcarbamoyl adenosine modification protein (Sua5/YciO/YrdC/YwlC family)
VNDALKALRSGEVIVIPTDTVYGLACLPNIAAAVAKIFALKGRSAEKALPVLGHSAQALADVAEFDDRAVELALRFWPGPLTLVLPRAEGFTSYLGEDAGDSVAVRVPQNEVSLELLRASGPLAVTSANVSGEPPAGSADEAADIFGGEVSTFLDGGQGRGVPSTIASLIGDLTILREGAITRAEIDEVLP